MSCGECQFGRSQSVQQGGGINLGYGPRTERKGRGRLAMAGKLNSNPVNFVTKVHCLKRVGGIEWRTLDDACGQGELK